MQNFVYETTGLCMDFSILKLHAQTRFNTYYRLNHSIMAFSSWSMLYQHTRHRNGYKFKTLCQKLASVFVLPVAQTRNHRRNYQIFTSSRKTLKMTFFQRYVLHFKNYPFLMKKYCTMQYKNLRFWYLIA